VVSYFGAKLNKVLDGVLDRPYPLPTLSAWACRRRIEQARPVMVWNLELAVSSFCLVGRSGPREGIAAALATAHKEDAASILRHSVGRRVKDPVVYFVTDLLEVCHDAFDV
jgi:hypothetical protein